MKISRSCYSNFNCWSVIIFVLVSLVEPWTCLECGNTSSTRISSPNTDGGYIVDIHHPLFDPQVDLVPSQNYTVSLHSGNVDSSIAGIMVTVESEAGTDVGRIISTDNCTLNLPLNFIWTVPNSDSSCLYVRIKIFETYGSLYEVNYTTCANLGCRFYYNAGALGGLGISDYLDFYRDGLNCTYVIYSLARATIFLQFQKVGFEDSYGGRCYDQVTVFYDNQTKPLMCGVQSTEDVRNLYFISTTGVIYVQFYADSKLHSRGFRAVYYEMQNTECNRTFTNFYGIIGSFNSSKNTQIPYCEYDIRLPSLYNIEITLDYLYLPRNNDKQCTDTSIELIHTDNSEKITLCGYKTDLPSSQLFYRHHNNTLRMRYYTGNNTDDHVGFQIRYRGVPACVNETSSNKSGTFLSFSYPDNYIDDQECYFVIEVIDSFVIELYFDMLYTESVKNMSLQGNRCTFDYIELYVNDDTYRICGNWEGKEHLLRFVFNSSKIVIKFASNKNSTKPGYKVTWYTFGPEHHNGTCLAPLLDTWRYCYEIVHTNVSWWEGFDECRQKGAMLATIDDIQTIGMLSKALAQRSFESVWIGANDIEAEGDFYWADKSKVKFAMWFRSWSEFYSSKQASDDGLWKENCVELRKQFAHPSKEGNTGKYFWNNKQCDSKNSYICQYLKSDDTEASSNRKEDCNLDILLTNDNPVATLKSPFFPTDYLNDLDCSVIVKAPIGSHPTLQFHHFDIEDSDNCIFDNVTITDSIDTSPSVFCGNWTDRLKLLQRISTTNLILFRFQTDRSRTAAGFSATVEFVISKLCPAEELGPKWFAGPNSCFHLPAKQYQTYLDATKTCEGTSGDILNELTTSSVFFLRNLMDDLSKHMCKEIENGSYFWIQGNTSVTNNGSSENSQSDAVNDINISTILLNSATGTIWSPGYPYQNYSNNILITYHIIAPEGYLISLNINTLCLEDHENCLYDSLETKGFQVDSVYCGRLAAPVNIVSFNKSATLMFKTDKSISAKGFLLTWQSFHPVFCLEDNETTYGSHILSLSFLYSFPFAIHCCRTISFSSAPPLLLGNKNFNIPEVSCSESAMEQQLSAKNGSIRTFCSSKTVNNTTDLSFILLQNENLTVCMKTPFNHDGQGFLASFSYECGNLSFAILDRSLDQQEKIISRFTCETFFNITARIFTVRPNRIVIWVYSGSTNGFYQSLQFVISAITFQGLFCQVTVCDSNPCKNGKCSLTPRGFSCMCNSGFWGVFCEKDELVCRHTVCSGHGNCIGKNTSHPSCHCTSGWTGVKCDVPLRTLYQELSIGAKLMKEPMWIGIILLTNLSVLFCLSYAIRRKCGDRIIQMFPKRKPRSVERKSSQASDETSPKRNVFSLVIDIPRIETESTTDDSLPTSPTVSSNMQAQTRKYIDSNYHERNWSPDINKSNREAAARFFASYKSSETHLTSDEKILQHSGSIRADSLGNDSPSLGIIGGQLKFSFDSPPARSHATSCIRSRSFDLQLDSPTTGTQNKKDVMFRQVKRTVSLDLQSGIENLGIDSDRKGMNPRAALINSEHYYPNIIILNQDSNKMDTSEYSNSWSNDKGKQSWNSVTFTERFSPDKHLDEWSAESGCSSISNAKNTQCDRPHVWNAISFDVKQPKHSLEAERRRQYASKNKSTSVYNEIIDCNALRRRIVVELSYKDVSKNKRNTQQSHKVARKFECNWQKNSRRKIKRRTIFRYSSSDDLSSKPRHHTYYECKRYQGTDEKTGRRKQHNRMYVHEYISGICVDKCLRHAYSLPDRCVSFHSRSREILCSYSPSAKRLSKRSLQLYKSSSSFKNDDYKPYTSASKKRRSYQKIAQHSGEFFDVRRRWIDIWKVRHLASLYIPISRQHGDKKKDFKAETVYYHLKSKRNSFSNRVNKYKSADHWESTTVDSFYNLRISPVHGLYTTYPSLHKHDLIEMRSRLFPQFNGNGDSSSSPSIRSSPSCSTFMSVQYSSNQMPGLIECGPKDSAYQTQHPSFDSRPSADSNCNEFSGVRSEQRCPESTVQKQFQRTSIKLKMLKRQQAYNRTSKDSDIHTSEDEHASEEIDPSLSRERSITIKPDLEYFKKKNEHLSEVEEEKFRHMLETSLEGKAQKNSHGEKRPINIFLPNSVEQEYCANIEEIEMKEINV